MQKIRDWLVKLSPITRRMFLTIGFITLAFIGFTLTTISDLLAPRIVWEYIVNPVPILISIAGCVAIYLIFKNRNRLASYLMIGAIFVGFLVLSIFSPQPIYATVAELVIVILPMTIAVQSLSEREFTWVIVASI